MTNSVINYYNNRGFDVRTCIVDGEFECLHPHLVGGINLNTTALNEYAAEIEQHIRTIKECFRAVRSTLPFKRLPARLIIELVFFAS